jgi:hypothetical protein
MVATQVSRRRTTISYIVVNREQNREVESSERGFITSP